MAVAEKEELSFEKVWKMFQETDKRFQETAIRFQETDLKFQETDKNFEKTSNELTKTKNTIDELGRQIGGIGNKFGTFTEGIYVPSVKKILNKEFNCTKSFQNATLKVNGTVFEIDLLGESDKAFYLVEIKSHLKTSAIEQLKSAIFNFDKVEERAKTKPKYGILVAASFSEETKQEVIKNGFYFVSTTDDIAELAVPDDFVPKAW